MGAAFLVSVVSYISVFRDPRYMLPVMTVKTQRCENPWPALAHEPERGHYDVLE